MTCQTCGGSGWYYEEIADPATDGSAGDTFRMKFYCDCSAGDELRERDGAPPREP